MITEDVDTHQKDKQAWRGTKTESCPETLSASRGIPLHLTKRRKLSAALNSKLIDMLRRDPQRPVQQPRHPVALAINVARPHMGPTTCLMENLRNTLRRKIEKTLLKTTMESPVAQMLEEGERPKVGKTKNL